jgi:ribose transport system ATP-binding protein
MIRDKLHSIVLEARSVSKRFPGVLALNNVNLRIYTGKVNAIVGENGAGKSTLMNILSGVYTDYDGDLFMDGKNICFNNTSEAQHAGISMIHQELNLVPQLTIAENIFLGREPVNRAGIIDYNRMRREAAIILNKLEFKEDVNIKVSDLRIGQQQIVEIAKSLSVDARILIMDEPTSALSDNESRVLFDLIRSLTAKGVAIVYITHKIDELEELADYVTVLRDGSLVAEAEKGRITTDEIVKFMVGREAKDFFVKKEHDKGKWFMEAEGITLKHPVIHGKFLLKDISFRLAASEVLGVYGLMGAGRTELLETIFGLYPLYTSGIIKIAGKTRQINCPSEAIKHGVALIPEDRKNDGLVLGMNIAQNISLASLDNIRKNGLLSRKLERNQADTFRKKLNIKSYSPYQITGKLSGGNQQKVVISKWMVTRPKILLLDEPTRGIDINAKNEIYKLIDDLAAQGLAIMVVSSELPEIMAISDRIVTICNGKLTGEFGRSEFSEENILKAALPDNSLN